PDPGHTTKGTPQPTRARSGGSRCSPRKPPQSCSSLLHPGMLEPAVDTSNSPVTAAVINDDLYSVRSSIDRANSALLFALAASNSSCCRASEACSPTSTSGILKREI